MAQRLAKLRPTPPARRHRPNGEARARDPRHEQPAPPARILGASTQLPLSDLTPGNQGYPVNQKGSTEVANRFARVGPTPRVRAPGGWRKADSRTPLCSTMSHSTAALRPPLFGARRWLGASSRACLLVFALLGAACSVHTQAPARSGSDVGCACHSHHHPTDLERSRAPRHSGAPRDERPEADRDTSRPGGKRTRHTSRNGPPRRAEAKPDETRPRLTRKPVKPTREEPKAPEGLTEARTKIRDRATGGRKDLPDREQPGHPSGTRPRDDGRGNVAVTPARGTPVRRFPVPRREDPATTSSPERPRRVPGDVLVP